MPKSKPAGRAPGGRIVLLISPKGGTGKSSLARHLLVCGALAGLNVLGIDFDRQSTLTKWAQRREKLRQGIPEIPAIAVRKAEMAEWRQALEATAGCDLAVIDTPPAIEDHYNAALGLGGAAHLTLLPCGQTQDDYDSVAPWMEPLASAGLPAAFVMNKANRRTRSYDMIRGKLLKVGRFCSVEIPLLEEVHMAQGNGLTVMDVKGSKAGATFDALWSYVAREIDLAVKVPA
jgi:chromosome partitioning protein